MRWVACNLVTLSPPSPLINCHQFYDSDILQRPDRIRNASVKKMLNITGHVLWGEGAFKWVGGLLHLLSDIDPDIHLHKSPFPPFLVHMWACNCHYKATSVSSGWPNKIKDITTESLIPVIHSSPGEWILAVPIGAGEVSLTIRLIPPMIMWH